MNWLLALVLAVGAALACVALDFLFLSALPRWTQRATARRAIDAPPNPSPRLVERKPEERDDEPPMRRAA